MTESRHSWRYIVTFLYSGKFTWVDGKQVPLIGTTPITHSVSDLDLFSTHDPSEHSPSVQHEGTGDVMTQKPHASPDRDVRK